jgi:hypothetical protein
MPPIRNTETFVKENITNNQAVAEVSSPVRVLAYIFLAASVIVSAVLYGVNYLLVAQNQKIQTEISIIEADLTTVPLNEMLTFYNKIESINNLLRNHTYPSSILSVLSELVEEDTYFKSFSLNTRDKNEYTLALSAVALDKTAIVRQVDNLKDDTYKNIIKSVDLKNITSDRFGNVTYDLNLMVNARIKPELERNFNLPPNSPQSKLEAVNSNSSLFQNINSASTTINSTGSIDIINSTNNN